MVFAWFYKGFRLMSLFRIEKMLVLATQGRNPAEILLFPAQDKQIAPDMTKNDLKIQKKRRFSTKTGYFI